MSVGYLKFLVKMSFTGDVGSQMRFIKSMISSIEAKITVDKKVNHFFPEKSKEKINWPTVAKQTGSSFSPATSAGDKSLCRSVWSVANRVFGLRVVVS